MRRFKGESLSSSGIPQVRSISFKDISKFVNMLTEMSKYYDLDSSLSFKEVSLGCEISFKWSSAAMTGSLILEVDSPGIVSSGRSLSSPFKAKKLGINDDVTMEWIDGCITGSEDW